MQEYSFFQNFTDELWELDIVIACHGVSNCADFASPGIAFAVVGGQLTCSYCVSSGEQQVVGLSRDFLNAGFLNVTDPLPSTLAFYIDSAIAPGFTEFTGRVVAVPEPPSLLLLAAAVVLSCLGWR